MLDIKTPLIKGNRVSRKVDPANFVAVPGIWAKVAADGSVANVATGVNPAVAVLIISNASSNIYESHDITIGRITSLETPGFRCTVDVEGYVPGAGLLQGVDLVISSVATEEGKLISADDAVAGTYVVVARCETIDVTAGLLSFVTVSPRSLVIT